MALLINKLFASRKKAYNKHHDAGERTFSFSQEQVRVVLFRECDFRGRKLLFDSQSVQKIPVPVTPNKNQGAALNGSQTSKNEVFVEVSNGYGYQYSRPSSDIVQLGEMVFGSVAMSFRGTSLKIHSFSSPAKLMCTQVFPSPRHPRGRLSVTSQNFDALRSNSSVHSFEKSLKLDYSSASSTTSFNEQTSLYSTESDVKLANSNGSVPLDVPSSNLSMTNTKLAPSLEGDSGFCGEQSYSSVSSGPPSMSLWDSRQENASVHGFSCGSLYKRWLRSASNSLDYNACSDNSLSGAVHSSASADECMTRGHHRSSKLGLAVIIHLSEGQEIDLERYLLEHSALIEAMVCRARCGAESAYTKPGSFASLMYDVFKEISQWLTDLISGPTIGTYLWHILGQRPRSKSFSCDTQKSESRSEMGKTKSESSLVKSNSKSNLLCQRTKNNLLLTSSLLEIDKGTKYFDPSASIESAKYLGFKNSVSKSDERLKYARVNDGFPNDASLNAEKFVRELCELLEAVDTKHTNFFISTLLTAVLTHHLGWVSTVVPPAHSDVETISKLHSPCNPLWGQLSDLYGAVGCPTKIAHTIICGSAKLDVISKILYTLTYFIRCSVIERNFLFRYSPSEENMEASNIFAKDGFTEKEFVVSDSPTRFTNTSNDSSQLRNTSELRTDAVELKNDSTEFKNDTARFINYIRIKRPSSSHQNEAEELEMSALNILKNETAEVSEAKSGLTRTRSCLGDLHVNDKAATEESDVEKPTIEQSRLKNFGVTQPEIRETEKDLTLIKSCLEDSDRLLNVAERLNTETLVQKWNLAKEDSKLKTSEVRQPLIRDTEGGLTQSKNFNKSLIVTEEFHKETIHKCNSSNLQILENKGGLTRTRSCLGGLFKNDEALKVSEELNEEKMFAGSETKEDIKLQDSERQLENSGIKGGLTRTKSYVGDLYRNDEFLEATKRLNGQKTLMEMCSAQEESKLPPTEVRQIEIPDNEGSFLNSYRGDKSSVITRDFKQKRMVEKWNATKEESKLQTSEIVQTRIVTRDLKQEEMIQNWNREKGESNITSGVKQSEFRTSKGRLTRTKSCFGRLDNECTLEEIKKLEDDLSREKVEDLPKEKMNFSTSSLKKYPLLEKVTSLGFSAATLQQSEKSPAEEKSTLKFDYIQENAPLNFVDIHEASDQIQKIFHHKKSPDFEPKSNKLRKENSVHTLPNLIGSNIQGNSECARIISGDNSDFDRIEEGNNVIFVLGDNEKLIGLKKSPACVEIQEKERKSKNVEKDFNIPGCSSERPKDLKIPNPNRVFHCSSSDSSPDTFTHSCKHSISSDSSPCSECEKTQRDLKLTQLRYKLLAGPSKLSKELCSSKIVMNKSSIIDLESEYEIPDLNKSDLRRRDEFNRSQSVPPSDKSQRKCSKNGCKKKYSGVKFDFKQYPQIVTNYMKSQNLDISQMPFAEKSLKLNRSFSASLYDCSKFEFPTCDCEPQNEETLQTPSNASELEFTSELSNEKFETHQPREKTERKSKSFVKISLGEETKNLNQGRKENVEFDHLLQRNSTKENNAIFEHEIDAYEGKSASKETPKITFIELPMPRIISPQPSNENLNVGYTHSLLRGVGYKYISDMVLQGTLSSPKCWEHSLRRDLALAAKKPLLDQTVQEAVAIVANTDTWEVQLVSSHTYVVEKGSLGIRVGMSQLVANMLESLLHMWKLKTPPEYCLMHIESRLREFCVRSKALAQLLMSTDFCNMELLTSCMQLEVDDVPLMMAVASTHTPQVTHKYGLSFQ